MKWEEVAVAIAKREEEIMEAVRNLEVEVDVVCVQREEFEEVKRELEESTKKVQQQNAATVTTTKGSLRSYILDFIIAYSLPCSPEGEGPS